MIYCKSNEKSYIVIREGLFILWIIFYIDHITPKNTQWMIFFRLTVDPLCFLLSFFLDFVFFPFNKSLFHYTQSRELEINYYTWAVELGLLKNLPTCHLILSWHLCTWYLIKMLKSRVDVETLLIWMWFTLFQPKDLIFWTC